MTTIEVLLRAPSALRHDAIVVAERHTIDEQERRTVRNNSLDIHAMHLFAPTKEESQRMRTRTDARAGKTQPKPRKHPARKSPQNNPEETRKAKPRRMKKLENS
jgi:hypothetical protein